MSYYDKLVSKARWQDFRMFAAYATLVTGLASAFAIVVMYAGRYL